MSRPNRDAACTQFVFFSPASTSGSTRALHLQRAVRPEGRLGALQGHQGALLLQRQRGRLPAVRIRRLRRERQQLPDHGRMRGNVRGLRWVRRRCTTTDPDVIYTKGMSLHSRSAWDKDVITALCC